MIKFLQNLYPEFFLVCALMLFFALLYAFDRMITGKECEYQSRVTMIGACNSNGNCGVRLADGTVLKDVKQPVVGAKPSGLCKVVQQ